LGRAMIVATNPADTLEIEVKIHVASHLPIRLRLEEEGAILTAPRVYERNVRYEDEKNSLTRNHRVLRLRQDSRARLTYKEPVEEKIEGVQVRTELEVTVDDFEMMDIILEKLGYIPAWTYEKYRTTYELFGAEITLDELPYGYFVEVEGALDAIERIVPLLFEGPYTRIKGSYSDLFFRVKKQLGLKVNDLTFENFKGIQVPDDAFLRAEDE
jgi:adenylate cyclase class 2